MTICPCCGQQTDALPIEKLVRVVSDRAAEIVTLLARDPGDFVACSDVVRWAYRHDPEGGPLNARTCINQIISYNRQKLAAMGWLIEGRLGPYGGYRLSVHPDARQTS